jgi:hypothetical protein
MEDRQATQGRLIYTVLFDGLGQLCVLDKSFLQSKLCRKFCLRPRRRIHRRPAIMPMLDETTFFRHGLTRINTVFLATRAGLYPSTWLWSKPTMPVFRPKTQLSAFFRPNRQVACRFVRGRLAQNPPEGIEMLTTKLGLINFIYFF